MTNSVGTPHSQIHYGLPWKPCIFIQPKHVYVLGCPCYAFRGPNEQFIINGNRQYLKLAPRLQVTYAMSTVAKFVLDLRV